MIPYTVLVRVCQLLIFVFVHQLFLRAHWLLRPIQNPHQSFDHDHPLPPPHITPQINIFFFFLTTFSLPSLPTFKSCNLSLFFPLPLPPPNFSSPSPLFSILQSHHTATKTILFLLIAQWLFLSKL